MQELKNGETCVTYTDESQSYGDCIEQQFKHKMMSMFGCLPPWIQTADDLEKCPMKIKDFYGRNGTDEVIHNVFDLVDNQKLFDLCPPSCLKMDIKLEEIMHRYSQEYSEMDISWPVDVQVVGKIS